MQTVSRFCVPPPPTYPTSVFEEGSLWFSLMTSVFAGLLQLAAMTLTFPGKEKACPVWDSCALVSRLGKGTQSQCTFLALEAWCEPVPGWLMACLGLASSLLVCDVEIQGHHSGTVNQKMQSCTCLLLGWGRQVYEYLWLRLRPHPSPDPSIQGLASLCQLCSPHAAQGPATGGIGCLGFHLPASKPFRRVFL